MTGNISPLGWVIIIALALFILALNLGLFMGFKKKSGKDSWMEKMANAGKTMKAPFKKEDDQYKQLSQEIEKIRQRTSETNKD